MSSTTKTQRHSITVNSNTIIMTKPQNYSKPIDKYNHVCYNVYHNHSYEERIVDLSTAKAMVPQNVN